MCRKLCQQGTRDGVARLGPVEREDADAASVRGRNVAFDDKRGVTSAAKVSPLRIEEALGSTAVSIGFRA